MCGDGITYSIYVAGALMYNAPIAMSQSASFGGVGSPVANIPIAAGQYVSVAIGSGPSGSYGCDPTQIDIAITGGDPPTTPPAPTTPPPTTPPPTTTPPPPAPSLAPPTFTPTPAPACVGSPPTEGAVCRGTVWILSNPYAKLSYRSLLTHHSGTMLANVTIEPNQVLQVSAGTSIAPNATISIALSPTDSTPPIAFQGAVVLDGSLVLLMPANATMTAAPVFSAPAVSGEFARVSVQFSDGCKVTSSTRTQSAGAGLQVLVAVPERRCGGGMRPAIIAAIAVGAVIGFGLILLVVLLWVRRYCGASAAAFTYKEMEDDKWR